MRRFAKIPQFYDRSLSTRQVKMLHCSSSGVKKFYEDKKFKLSTISLILLILQNSGLAVTMRMSRISKDPVNLYLISTAVVMSEFIKLIASVAAYLSARKELGFFNACQQLYNDFNEYKKDILKVSVPSGLYVMQNNLQYIAMSNLPVGVYQVLIQLKTLSTSIFSRLLLMKYQSFAQWFSIFSLTIGVTIVQLSFQSSKTLRNVNLLIGLSSVFATCISSGIAGAYNEKILKKSSTTYLLWLTNIQMSLISIAVGLFSCLCDYEKIKTVGFFHGYDALVWTVIGLQAFGGLITAFVVKYTDSIVKSFATSVSILLSCFFSIYFVRDLQTSVQFLFGATVVTLSALLYSFFSITKTKKISEQKS
jgi:UDP-sugar transporter A1/2/3